MRAAPKAAIASQSDLTPDGQQAKPTGQAFPRHYRLLGASHYKAVFAYRRALKSRHFLLHYRLRAEEELAAARLGVVVAKRLARRAVDRNLVRRLARESFRLLHPRLGSVDLVLRLVSRPPSLDRRELSDEIRALFRRMVVRK